MKKIIEVVAGIIENEKKEIFCVKRSESMSLPNFWEFPGGKVEKNESFLSALKRELLEELEIKSEIEEKIFSETVYHYENFSIKLICFKVKFFLGDIILKEHSEKIWLERSQLKKLKWAPADIEVVEKLQNEGEK
ncbi:MAG: (deoxy)nucleoside triphosphate pyrophosphohydrolase [Fusobacteriaceae bacterium]